MLVVALFSDIPYFGASVEYYFVQLLNVFSKT
jgi:hypothetical protein